MIFVVVSLFFQYVIGLGAGGVLSAKLSAFPVLRALFLVPWLLPIIVSATTWQWMFDADSESSTGCSASSALVRSGG